jgi:hypothetical protein
MISPNDWRLQGQEKYLIGITLYFRPWATLDPSWDHDHCEFCWVRFTNLPVEDHLHEGYATANLYRWICPSCFDDFKEMFGWTLGRFPE